MSDVVVSYIDALPAFAGRSAALRHGISTFLFSVVTPRGLSEFLMVKYILLVGKSSDLSTSCKDRVGE